MNKMHKCNVRFNGPVKEIMKFMIDNMEFSEVSDVGVKFIVGLDFGKLMKEHDELFMKDQYGVNLKDICINTKVFVSNVEYKEYYDDEYYDYDERPKNIYEFEIQNHGCFFDVTKVYEKEVCFKDEFVKRPKEFMSEFFNYFSLGSINSRKDQDELIRRMNLSSVLEIEFFTYAFPVEILNAWRSKYKLNVRAHWADENEFLIYARYQDDPEDLSEDKYVQHITAEKSLQRYTEMLCVRKWLDCHAMVIDVCNMLYDMKDNFPVKIDLELKEIPEGEVTFNSNNPFKYNVTYGSISNTIYGLANNGDNFTLAKMYAALTKMHETFMNENK